jgi:hypothetical protein
MRLVCLCLAIAACSEKPSAVPPKPPNNELIVDTFERKPPDGMTAIRFRADGSYRIGHDKSQIDKDPPVAAGTWTLDKDQLTLHASAGQCADAAGTKDGTYAVVISKIGIHFKKQHDSCERRSAYDGQTWWRVK